MEGSKALALKWFRDLNFSLVNVSCVCGRAGVAALDGGGPTGTPLPDKKLLLFILDRLQK